MKNYALKIIPLTPIHIGTGKEFGPLEYTVVEVDDGKQTLPQFWKFSAEKIIASLNKKEQKELMKIIDSNNIKSIVNYLSDKVEINNILYSSSVTDTFLNIFSHKIDDPNNQMVVGEMYRCKNDCKPVIPGSSLKGAIRTAFISEIAKSNKILRSVDKYRFEREALSYEDGKDDPFRMLRISDIPINGKNSGFVGTIYNYKKNLFSNMQIIVEQISGLLNDCDTSGTGQLSLNNNLFGLQTPKKGNGTSWQIKTNITIEQIVNSCNNFYKENLLNEHRKFYSVTTYSSLKETSEKLLLIAEEITSQKNTCLLRVGKFVQAENVTVKLYRKPLNFKGWGNTRNISDQKWPMGWAKVIFNEM